MPATRYDRLSLALIRAIAERDDTAAKQFVAAADEPVQLFNAVLAWATEFGEIIDYLSQQLGIATGIDQPGFSDLVDNLMRCMANPGADPGPQDAC